MTHNPTVPDNGTETEVHGLAAPEMYEDFDEPYRHLLGAVDAGLVITVEDETHLDNFTGGSHSGVLALVHGSEDPSFYVSENGEFNDPISLDMDLEDLSDDEIDAIISDIEHEFVSKDGDSMTGTLDLSNGGLILPTD